MLKNLSLILALSVAVTACGGGSSGKKNPTSSSVSSTSSSVAVSSSSSSVSSTSSSVAPSSVSSSSSSSEEASVSSTSSSTSSAADVDLSYSFAEGINGWFVNGEPNETTLITTNLSLEHDQVNGGLKISPLNWAANNWLRFAKFNMGEVHNTTGATFTVVINVPQSYIDDTGLKLQWIVANAEGTDTQYGNYIDSAGLIAGDNTLTITDRNLANARYFGLQLTTAPTSTAIIDPILVKSVEIKFAEASSSSSSSEVSSSSSTASSAPTVDLTKVDFESDTVGTNYPIISWYPTDLIASTVTISSISDLPANGASTKVVKIVVNNWNAGTVFNLTVPSGKTLGDYAVKVDAYLPKNSLGLTNNENNEYKDLILIAGAELSGALGDSNAAFISKVPTGVNVDAWHTFTLPTNNSTLTGALKVALGLHRPKGNDADAYYFDNIRLEPK